MIQTVSIEEVNAITMFHSLPMQFGETDLCITANYTQPFNYKCLHQKPQQSPQIAPPTYIYVYIYIYVCVCVCEWALMLHMHTHKETTGLLFRY